MLSVGSPAKERHSVSSEYRSVSSSCGSNLSKLVHLMHDAGINNAEMASIGDDAESLMMMQTNTTTPLISKACLRASNDNSPI